MNPTLDTRAKDGPMRNQLAGAVLCMAHGQAGAEVVSDGSPSLTCNHEAPIIAHSLRSQAQSAHDATLETYVAHSLRAEGHDASEDGTVYAIGSHAGAAEGDASNRSHNGGGPVGSNISEELAYSLRSDRTQSVATDMAVRRLTPRECERLMGLPDDYTLIPYRGKPAKDGPRYKALGNSMAVNVMRWLGTRIQMVEDAVPTARRVA